uniref:Probable pectate lyase F n=1 Tax=Ditylenchus dipsaci TaxID=166011 RepID=A0A915EJU8_9BILA
MDASKSVSTQQKMMLLQVFIRSSRIIGRFISIMFCYIAFFAVVILALLESGICDFWPAATGNITINATIVVNVSKTFNCNYTRYIPNPTILGDGGTNEFQSPVFELQGGATLKNCIIGAAPGTNGSADGVHCTGAGCLIQNVWFEDVGEDAITFNGLNSSNINYTIDGGGARYAHDKIVMLDGRGTAYIKNFWADIYARFARSCGNCKDQYERHMVISNLTAYNGTAGQYIAGVNMNYNDSAIITGLKLGGAGARQMFPCKRFIGTTGPQPTVNGSDADGKYCIYNSSDITYL